MFTLHSTTSKSGTKAKKDESQCLKITTKKSHSTTIYIKSIFEFSSKKFLVTFKNLVDTSKKILITVVKIIKKYHFTTLQVTFIFKLKNFEFSRQKSNLESPFCQRIFAIFLRDILTHFQTLWPYKCL